MREPIGEINCPLCQRGAELHASSERRKLDPDGGEGKRAYPRKFYVVCPPVAGYRGCGTILAHGGEAQARLMDLGRIFGPQKDSRAGPRKASESVQMSSAPAAAQSAAKSPAPPAAAAAAQAAAPAKPGAKPGKNPFSLWNW